MIRVVLLDKVNPINLLYYIPILKKKKEQYKKEVDEALFDKVIGVSIFRATYFMCGLISIVALTITNFIVALIGVKVNHSTELMIGLVLTVSFFDNFVLLKQENYIKVFDEFDSLSRKKRYLGHLISFFVVVVAFLLLFISFFWHANKYYIG
ncbi:hypothetical protein P8625_09965 [Tenacibaculum tangerinum]|uniref:ABC transporter permease n=1 Tax=Tenacibaculum tangerinum TaxID=3038772 RepID=A0ABY8L011_9FLAO|nr:hypothetical protein [Tenacibaculum tangerinum]WGH74431.1 hypothetical protein P8625_09965 [Tenacibaculum tangerinum]